MDLVRSRTYASFWSPAWAVMVLIGSLSGCAPEASAPFRIGINPWPSFDFIYLAEEKGYFRDEHIDVRVVEFSSLADTKRSYERGQLDAIATTVVEVLQIRDHSGRSPRIVQVMDYSAGADVILGQTSISSVKGLRGARVGVEMSSLGSYILERGLEAGSLHLDDVHLVSMHPLVMEEAFLNGSLDAMVAYPPVSTKVLAGGKAHVLFSSAQIPGEVLDVIAVEAEVARKRPRTVAGFLKAIHRAKDYARTSPDDAYRIMSACEGLTPAAFVAALTDGIQLVGALEQGSYLAETGKLSTVVDRTDRVLRLTHQIAGPDRRPGVIDQSFAGRVDKP